MPPSENPSPGDEAALIAAARQGSTDALGALFTEHAPRVLAVAYRITGSVQDAEDVLQDVFVMLPEALQGYGERGKFAPWLKRVAALTALMRVRSRGRRREEADVALSTLAARPQTDAVDRIAMQRALASLPNGLRAVFVLKEIEGYSHAEIADMLGITSGNSAARLFRAWKLLREAAA